MLVNSMQEKVNLLAQLFETGHFSARELAKIAISMELNASITVLEQTLDSTPNQRYAVLQVFQQHQSELDKTN